MSYYVITGHDRPNSLKLRQETRPRHLDYLAKFKTKVQAAGPLLGDDGKAIGSMIILDAKSIEEADQWAAADPYAQANLFASIDIRAWDWTINPPEA